MNRKLGLQVFACITIFLLIYTALSPIVQSVPPVPEQVLIVDIDGTGDYTSIQAAINNSTGGEAIMIRSGIYTENSITVNRMIRIVGEDPTSTIVNCNGKPGFAINSPAVEISNLKITNSLEYTIKVSSVANKCNISNIVIDGQKHIGILVEASNVKISKCDIKGIGAYGTGIQLRKFNSVIEDCNIQGFTVGVLILINSDGHEILNCNLFNNEIAVDIRIDSNNNLVSDCNIYANDLGVYVWQNSRSNRFYLNNFWRNNADVKALVNNTWDNGISGNYWDSYSGVDTNSDGIGNTPYQISDGNVDRFPLISMIMPDEITMPTGVRTTSSSSDGNPSFTWNPSLYSNGIKGYYVKIDNNPEIFIGDTTSWTSTDSVLDGVHTFYVRAETMDNTSSDHASVTFLIDTAFIDLDDDGWSDAEEEMYGTDPEDSDNYPLDTDGDRVPDSFDSDDDNDGYSDDMELAYGTSTIDANRFPTDTDGDGVPDEDSPDGTYTGDVDDDDDGLVDTIETKLGSNTRDGADVTKIYISGSSYYLVDISNSGTYDVLYEPTGDVTTGVEKHNDDYLIDADGNGLWDHLYQTADGSVSTYAEEQPALTLVSWILLILTVIITASILVFYYLRKKPRIYAPFRKLIKLARRPSVKKPLPIRPADAKDTVEMIGRTQTLLQHIQQDVKVYMEQLDQMQDQLMTTTMATEKEILRPEKETIEPEIVEDETEQEVDTSVSGDVESQVDAILARLEDKDKD